MSSLARNAAVTPVRVLHVIETMLGMGGMEKGVVNLTHWLPRERFEHVVCVIRSLGPLADNLPCDRVKLFCLGDKAPRFQAGALARLIKEVKPNVVHSRNWGAVEAVAAARWAGGCGVVHSEHGLESANADSEPWRRRVIRRVAFQLADRVFCVSNDLRSVHARRTGFPAARIGVIHNGVDTGRFRPADEDARVAARQRFGLAADEFCIGAIGRLEPVKDIGTLLRGASAFSRSCDRWRLLIAGDGSEAAPLREAASARPELRDHVTFLGDIEDVPSLLPALDAYVLSSQFEGICNSLLEAMAAGLPAIATAVGGNVEVVEDAESGLLFRAGDAAALARHLNTVHSDAEGRRRLRRHARARMMNEFSLSAMAAKYDRLYTSLAIRGRMQTATMSDKSMTGTAW